MGNPTVAAQTLAEIFYSSAEKYAGRPVLRWKEGAKWREWSYADLAQRVRDFAAGLLELELKRGDGIALFSKNCPEWAVTDWAAVAHGFVSVPIYDTLTAEKAAYILKDSGARAVVVQTKDQLNKIRSLRKQLPALRHVIVIEEVFEKSLESGETLFHQVVSSGRAAGARRGRELDKLRDAVRPDDLASIVYTSGTTGEPKGALLSQNNFASNAVDSLSRVPIEPGYLSLSFLPLSHVFERTGGHFIMILAGGTVAYAESIEKVPENLIEVKPNVVFSVPRLYEKIYARIQDKVRSDSWIKRYIFRKAIELGKKHIHEKYVLRVENPSTLRKWKRYDRLVYSKLKARVGGELRFFVSGGAPLSREIHEFFTAAGLIILQGYGLTETSPVLAVNTLEEFRIGSVGKPIPRCEIKIGADGEILAKGPMIFQGYHKKPKETKEAFTSDGYFKTGDIGRIDEDGYLYVTDRKKELLVMSNGKKVAPQPIENDLKTKRGIAQAVLIGNDKPYITALLSPDFEGLKEWAKKKGISFQDAKELVTRQEILDLFKEGVDSVNASLSQYEKIKKFRVLPQEFTQDSGELTPTLKVKRRVVDQKYGDAIEALYTSDGVKN